MNFSLLGHSMEFTEQRAEFYKVQNAFVEMRDSACRELKKECGLGTSLFISMMPIEQQIFQINNFVKRYSKSTNSFGDLFIKKHIADIRKIATQYGLYSISDEVIFNRVFEGRHTNLTEELNDFSIRIQRDSGDETSKLLKITDAFSSRIFDNAISEDISLIMQEIMLLLREKGFIEYELQKSYDEADALYKNLSEGLIPESERNEVAATIIMMSPARYTFYEYVFQNFPEARYDLVKIAKFFSIDLSAIAVAQIDKEYDIKTLETEEKALEIRKKLDKEMELYGLETCKKSIELDKMLKIFDEEARTFKGILYDTREIKAEAQMQDAEISEICAELSSLDRNICIEIREKLKSAKYIESVLNPYLTSIKERINHLEKSYLDELCLEVDSLVESECNELLEKIYSLRYDDENTMPFIEKVNNRIENIWDKEDYDKFSVIYLETNPEDDIKKQECISIVKNEGRTKSKQKFIDAFTSLNVDNLMTAAKYANATEKGGIAKITRLGKGHIYKTLTIGDTLKHPAMLKAMEQIKQDEAENGGFWGNIFAGKK